MLLAIEAIDGAVERLVSLREVGRHGEGIVEVGEGAAGVAVAGVEDGLRQRLDLLPLGVGDVAGPGEVLL